MRLEEVYKIFDSISPNENGCHEWPRGKVGGGYGAVEVEKRVLSAHRLAFERKLGRLVQPGLRVPHTCSCKSCVNPDHLFEGTSAIWMNNEKNIER
jgi:hypothetical protein